jgi:predicted negative regulator of RcsB-dependent stress response
MVPYNELNHIEQAILNWRNDNPAFIIVVLILSVLIVAACFIIEYNHNRKVEQMRISKHRKNMRRWIKMNGGL